MYGEENTSMAANPETVEDVEPWQDSAKRQLRICYCQKYASEYAGPVTVVGGTFWSLLGFMAVDWELTIYTLLVLRC